LNLFDSIGLKSDPFSTSPNVELFYPAAHHRQCLEGLELAIRMRRGLSVVRGGIGVGKTTVSRKLIQNFKKESDDFDFYLILDPKFESEIILLQHIIELFGVDEKGDSVQACRNIIENYLLKVGVEQGKVLVLIIDEGQNLPGEMLDVFRTLLNFETDDFKLLQLIIFGQPEMGNMIHKYPNFEDRISFDFEIGPTSIDDMRGMIDHRIVVCGGNEGDWFTDDALKKIHKNTQGYPRKVTQLCHQALLTMMSEGKTEITESIVEKVISGTSNSTGLLKQKKKNYNEIAVNKLLDVLKKDNPNDNKQEVETEDLDDDWIGGASDEAQVKSDQTVISSDRTTVDIPEDSKTEELSNQISKASLLEDRNSDTIQKKPLKSSFIQELIPKGAALKSKPISDLFVEEESRTSSKGVIDLPTETPKKGEINKSSQPVNSENRHHKEERIKNPGLNPVFQSVAEKMQIDKIAIGIGIDRGVFTAVLVQNLKGVKTLLAHHIQYAKDKNLSCEKNPDDFIKECKGLLKGLIDNFSERADLYKSALKLTKKSKSIYVTINDENMLMSLVNIVKENKKDKDQIISWNIRKKYPQFEKDLIINKSRGVGEKFNIGVARKSYIEDINNQFSILEWEIRRWNPNTQSLFNAFCWNYPEKVNKTILLINIGEKNSTIIGIQNSGIQVINELRIGVQNLNDALMDQGLSENEWNNRSKFQVPRSFILAVGKKVKAGEYDNIFTPVFENWQQDINRSINGLRKEMSINNETLIYLAGSATTILYLDDFFEGLLNYKTDYFNTVRNIAFSPNYDNKDQVQLNSTPFSSAVGSVINNPKAVDIMPPALKQNEFFRMLNRSVALIAIFLLLYLTTLTIKTKINKDLIQLEIEPIKAQNETMFSVKGQYDSLVTNTDNIKVQLQALNYDTEYFNRILVISRFLSFNTPKEVNIDEINFSIGWTQTILKRQGRANRSMVEKSDEGVRILKLVGNVKANAAIIDRHFEGYITSLESSGLFQLVEVIDEQTPVRESDKIEFTLKCII
tara:strand:+ start:1207 stop:4278 length:3072 start_codon:yes stop_codon:yes gene_type:complete